MKNLTAIRFMILVAILGLGIQACSKGTSPTGPLYTQVPQPSSTPTPTVSVGASQIFWFSAKLSRIDELGELYNAVDVYLSVNGQAETSSQVVLSSGNATLTVPYKASLNIAGNDYARYYLANGPFQYKPGTDYTLSTITSVGTAWASITAPGGITHDANGNDASWNNEGTNDRVYVQTSNFAGTYDSIGIQDDLTSIFSIPLTAYPSSGSYFIRTTCKTIAASVNNAMPGSSLIASDELWSSVYR